MSKLIDFKFGIFYAFFHRRQDDLRGLIRDRFILNSLLLDVVRILILQKTSDSISFGQIFDFNFILISTPNFPLF